MIRTRLVQRRDEWNTIVQELPRVDFRQSWQWGALRVSHGWSVLRVVAVTGDRPLAAAQVLVRRIPGLGPVLYAPRGPLVVDGTEGWSALPALVASLRAEVGATLLRVSPGVAIEEEATLAPLAAQKFHALPDLWSVWNTPRNVMRLDLAGSERDVLARMSRKRRQHVSTGARKGITTALTANLDALRTFHDIHREHGRRHGYPVPGWANMEALHREFGALGGLAVVTSHAHGQLATILVGIRFGPMAHTLYAAATPAAQKTPAGDLVHWELMRWAREAGCVELDLGSSCTGVPPDEHHPNYGIYRFKTELGARLTLCVGYRDRVFAPVRYLLARQLERSALHVNRRILGRLRLAVPAGRDAAPDSPPLPQSS
jgi:peptidoglycan pentaglycine glycine transferase (the first glycine)